MTQRLDIPETTVDSATRSVAFVAGAARTLNIRVVEADGITPQTMTGWALSFELYNAAGAQIFAKTTPTVSISNGAGTDDNAGVPFLAGDTDSEAPGRCTFALKRTDATHEDVLVEGSLFISDGSAVVPAYTAWELSPGDALAEIQSLCRHAARSNGGFSADTIPTLKSVQQYITLSYYWVNGELARHGLSTTQTLPAVVGILQQLNVYDVCIKIEMSLPVASATGEPNERFKFFVDRRAELMEQIANGTISSLFANEASIGLRAPIVTGLSYSRKALADNDRDRTQHRVKRDQFSYPGVAGPPMQDPYTYWSPS